jgi:hypothetical protein
MSAADRRLSVRFDEPLWQDVLGGLTREHQQIASAAHSAAERDGVALCDVHACAARGTDGTELAGCVKLYVPVSDGSSTGASRHTVSGRASRQELPLRHVCLMAAATRTSSPPHPDLTRGP